MAESVTNWLPAILVFCEVVNLSSARPSGVISLREPGTLRVPLVIRLSVVLPLKDGPDIPYPFVPPKD